MWIDRNGKNYTHAQVCSVLKRQCGSAAQAGDLIATYRIGAIYRNGGIWFQRVS